MQRTRPSATGLLVWRRPATKATRQNVITVAPKYQYETSTTSPVCPWTSTLTAASTPMTTAVTAACFTRSRVIGPPAEASRPESLRGRQDEKGAETAADRAIEP